MCGSKFALPAPRHHPVKVLRTQWAVHSFSPLSTPSHPPPLSYSLLPSLPTAGFGGRRSESSPPAPLPGRKPNNRTLSLTLSLTMLLNYEQRNSDFLRAVRRAARRNMEQGTTLNSRALVREVLASGAPAWYITTDYAWRRLKLLKAGKLHTRPGTLRRIMLYEIDALLRQACLDNPGADPYALLDDILSGSAATPSRFFISEEYARSSPARPAGLRPYPDRRPDGTGDARRHVPVTTKQPQPPDNLNCHDYHSQSTQHFRRDFRNIGHDGPFTA